MLNIRQVKHLAHRLEVPLERLKRSPTPQVRWCEELFSATRRSRTSSGLFSTSSVRSANAGRMLRAVLLPKLLRV